MTALDRWIGSIADALFWPGQGLFDMALSIGIVLGFAICWWLVCVAIGEWVVDRGLRRDGLRRWE